MGSRARGSHSLRFGGCGAAGPGEASAIEQASRRGALIYAYDQAAWHGADDMRTKIDDPASVLGGWIVDGPAEAPELIFFDKDEDDPKAVYVARFRDDQLVSSQLLGSKDDRTLNDLRKRMIKALATAKSAFAASGKPLCSDQPFNSVVVPPEKPGGPILVYLLTPQTTFQSVPFGGHHLIAVTSDGKAGPIRDFTKTCLDMPLRDGNGGKPAALAITHLLDPTPTEIHVFTSLTTRMPIFVSTTQNDKLWSVEGTRIRLVDRKPAR
ncbi:hypothetical protein [Flavisphingomonas formosensis]|uniref:hypothetical protein n=1 Tax=Flavisphingomonas formosensis TaxID=861534 RepID=UPI0012F9CFA4|nr:hypothetical protein [Sphingomonas formosensis]